MIEKQDVQELFPTPLWIVDLKPAPAAALNARLKAEIERLIAPRPAEANDSLKLSQTFGLTTLPGVARRDVGWEQVNRVLYIADVDLMAFGPMYADLGSTLADVRTTLKRCAEVDAGIYTTFHHKGPYFDRDDYLADLAVHAGALDAREERLRALLAEGPITPQEAVGRGVVYRVDGRRPWYADAVEEVMVAQHLAELEGAPG